MVQIEKFVKGLRSGSSLPLIMQGSDKRSYVVKAWGGGDGPLGSIVEYLASRLAMLLEIPALPPQLVHVPDGFVAGSGDQEIDELILQSPGVNYATEFLSPIQAYGVDVKHKPDQKILQDVLVLDILLLNIDRTPANPNMFFHNGALKSLDYASSLTIRGFIQDSNFSGIDILRLLKRHPFYEPDPDPRPLLSRLNAVDDKQLSAIVYAVPDQWIAATTAGEQLELWRRNVASRIMKLKAQRKLLMERIGLLKALHLETRAEAQKRKQENRERFERKYGKI